jgi:hypothetical protein
MRQGFTTVNTGMRVIVELLGGTRDESSPDA